MSTFLEELDLHYKNIAEAKQTMENASLLIDGAKQTIEHLKKYYSLDDFLVVNFKKKGIDISKEDKETQEQISKATEKYKKCVADLTTYDSALDKEILGNLSTYNRHLEMLQTNTTKYNEAEKLIATEEKAITKALKGCTETLTNCDLNRLVEELNKIYTGDKELDKITIAVKKKRIQIYNKSNIEPILTINDLSLTVGKLITKLNSYYKKESKVLS